MRSSLPNGAIPSAKQVVYAALAGNLLVAVTKTAAGLWTGSASMLSEAIHSFVDSGNELLLLYGLRQAARRADPEHPFGYGRELYFWSFLVALLVFALGAGVSLFEGIRHIVHPHPVTDPLVNYIVLALAFLFEGASWLVSYRQFDAAKGSLGFYEAFVRSKDPPSFMVLLEDSAALVGIVIAAVGTFAATRLQMPIGDGIASVLIGLVLAGTASLLARESKSLLIGERADDRMNESIVRIASSVDPRSRANGVLTVHLSPDQILAALSLEFTDDLRTPQIESAVIEIERRIRAAHPEVVTLFVKPQTDAVFREGLQLRYGDPETDADVPAGVP